MNYLIDLTFLIGVESRVEWDNGNRNNYMPSDLIVVDNVNKRKGTQTKDAAFEIGTSVQLLPGRYSDSMANPAIGGPHEVIGTTIQPSPKQTMPIRVRWDNDYENNYEYDDLIVVDNVNKRKGTQMKETIKNQAQKLHETLKPYEKYVGLAALALAIDHFLLGGRFTDRFKKIGEKLVGRVADSLDKLIEKLGPTTTEDTELAAEEKVETGGGAE